LNATPLDACIILSKELFWNFKTKNGCDVVHSIYVTDGDNTSPPFTNIYSDQCYNFTIKNGPFSYEYNNDTEIALDIFRDDTNSRVVSMFICTDHKKIHECSSFTNNLNSRDLVKATKLFCENGYVEIDSAYDRMFIINP